jgi:uncharacterized protein YggE
MTLRLAAMLVMVGLLGLAATGCDNSDTIIQGNGTPAGISVQGTGRASGVPNVAVLTLGVQVERPTVEEAREQAATLQRAIIDSLKVNGVAEKDIRTQQFSIQPQYDPPTPTRTQPPIRGYLVSNVLRIEIKDLNTTSKAIDDATRAGGNNTVVRGISFTIDEPAELESEARELAIEDARRRAEEIARHSGAGLGRLISVSESIGRATPSDLVTAPRTGIAQADTPIQAGELDIIVNVNVVYAID